VCALTHLSIYSSGWSYDSTLLQSKFGVGYNIVMSKTPSCQADVVTQLVKQHVPQADLLSSVGTELAFRLPIDASSQFPCMLLYDI
jgi:hypothetical protein